MKYLLFFISLILVPYIGFSQVPNNIKGINYQGIARDINGSPLIEYYFDLVITLYDNSTNIIFKEVHYQIETNEFGLFTLIIGTGTLTGGTYATLSSELWSNATQIKTEADFGSGLVEIGTVDLAAVPYAFKAKYEGQVLNLVGSKLYITAADGTTMLDSVDLSSINGGTGADNWGTQVAITSGSNISGDGTAANPLTVTDGDSDSFNEIELPTGGINGQILSTNGSGNYTWINDNGGSDTQNIIGSSFDATTGDLVIGIQNGTSQTLNFNGLKDHDWYKVGTPSPPSTINDDIFTNGKVGIGVNFLAPQAKLHIRRDNINNAAPALILGNTNQPSIEWIFDVSNIADLSITNENSSTSALFIKNNNDNVGIGTNSPTEKLEVNGTIKIDDSANPNELNRSSTGNANLVPIAYGRISTTGVIYTSASTQNVSNVTWDGVQYVISITGLSVNINSHNVFITPIGVPIAAGVNSLSGNLLVSFTANVQSQFNFIIYDK